MKRENQVLQQFFGAYFHQDWSLDDPDYEAVVHRYLADSSLEDIKLLTTELKQLLSADLSNSELTDLLTNEYLSSYLPSPGVSAKDWVQGIINLLEGGTI